MKYPTFLLITTLSLFAFGTLMFLISDLEGGLLGIETSLQNLSIVISKSGRIIITWFIWNFIHIQANFEMIKVLLLTYIFTHVSDLITDFCRVQDGAFSISSMAQEMTQ